jgi:large subunit ribosomal protein L23
MHIKDVLLQPVISENAVQAAGRNQYAFIVNADASKEEIKTAVERHYDVSVVTVATAQFRTSPRRQTRRRVENPGALQKKAYVTLKSGQKLDLLGSSEE